MPWVFEMDLRGAHALNVLVLCAHSRVGVLCGGEDTCMEDVIVAGVHIGVGEVCVALVFVWYLVLEGGYRLGGLGRLLVDPYQVSDKCVLVYELRVAVLFRAFVYPGEIDVVDGFHVNGEGLILYLFSSRGGVSFRNCIA